MPRFEITDPTGKRFEISAPDGATQEQALAYAQQQFSPSPATAATAPPQETSWSDVPRQALSNLVPSAVNFGKGIVQSVAHPLNTIGTLADAAVGGIQNALPKSIVDFANNAAAVPLPESSQNRITNTASGIGNFYKNRYGSVEGLKNTLATDPVGAAADVSTVLGAGAAVAPESSALANALRTGAKYTNPATPIVAAPGAVSDTAGFLAKHLLGLSTGVGPENVSQAFNAGKTGGTSFLGNLSGKVHVTDVLDAAQQNLANMRKANSAAYRSGMVDISKDQSVLDFSKIDNAVQDASGIGVFKGQVKNPAASKAVQAASDAVDNWKGLDPSQYHTPEGIDALKQQVGGILESIPYEQKTARLAVGNIYKGIKGTIAEQAPTYADVMKNYSEGSDLINEIQRTLSLKPTASVDTALRKLQSLSRNNVNTNYGYRQSLADALQSQGGNDLMPALSGQAMNSWMPRGVTGQGGAMASIAAALLHNPAMAAALPFQSPRAVGAMSYGAGKAAGALGQFPVTSQQARLAALIAAQAGKQGQ